MKSPSIQFLFILISSINLIGRQVTCIGTYQTLQRALNKSMTYVLILVTFLLLEVPYLFDPVIRIGT